MAIFNLRGVAAGLSLAAAGLALAAAGASPALAAAMAKSPPPLDVKPGFELTIPISIVDGAIVTGAPRFDKLGAGGPKDGEITIGLERQTGTLYNQITVTEKTPQPVDFLVTGLNGGTKIDETEICGRLDAPVTAHIGSVPWRFKLNGFEVGKGAPCP
jgi:hypothetical protein